MELEICDTFMKTCYFWEHQNLFFSNFGGACIRAIHVPTQFCLICVVAMRWDKGRGGLVPNLIYTRVCVFIPVPKRAEFPVLPGVWARSSAPSVCRLHSLQSSHSSEHKTWPSIMFHKCLSNGARNMWQVHEQQRCTPISVWGGAAPLQKYHWQGVRQKREWARPGLLRKLSVIFHINRHL